MKSFPWGGRPHQPHGGSADDPIAAGLWRELSEEVTLSQITSLTCVGLINETTGGVSDYHTALVYLLETTGEVTVRETEKMSGSWASPQELSAVFDRLETLVTNCAGKGDLPQHCINHPTLSLKCSKEIVHIFSSFFSNPLAFFFSPWYYY